MEIITNTGTEVKISVMLECASLTMDAMDFYAEFYTSTSKIVKVEKADMVRESESSYIAVVDTAGMASGSILMRVTAEIPDSDCADGTRTEIASIDTGIIIKR